MVRNVSLSSHGTRAKNRNAYPIEKTPPITQTPTNVILRTISTHSAIGVRSADRAWRRMHGRPRTHYLGHVFCSTLHGMSINSTSSEAKTASADFKPKDKSSRGNASQFFIAGELCRRGHLAVVTLGNTPNVDIPCSNREGTRFAHIQVKTFVPGNPTCSVGIKAMQPYGESFFWILGGIPPVKSDRPFEYYVIPCQDMAHHVKAGHDLWLKTPGKNGRPHQENKMRIVHLPPHVSNSGWDISPYCNAWHLIEKQLKG